MQSFIHILSDNYLPGLVCWASLDDKVSKMMLKELSVLQEVPNNSNKNGHLVYV